MGNPAELLLEILDRWDNVPGGQTAEGHRSDTSDWSMHRTAMRHLIEIERYIHLMRHAGGVSLEEYAPYIGRWTEAVVSYGVPWQTAVQTGTRPVMGPDSRAMLQGLASAMSMTTYAPPLPAENVERAVEAVSLAEQTIRESFVIGDDVKRYLLGLTNETVTVLRDLDTCGTVAARHVAFELGGAMLAQSTALTDPEASTWRSRAADVLQELMVFTGKAAIGYGALKAGIPPPTT